MFTVTRTMKVAIFAGYFATAAGCATSPPDLDLQRTFVPVQTHQMADLSLPCEDIRSQISDTENAVAVLDKQIHHDQDTSQMFSMMAAFSGMSGALANNVASAHLASANVILGDAGASASGQQAMTKAQLRDNIEQRHEALMQIFYSRGCQPG
jgi:hypothetical protein